MAENRTILVTGGAGYIGSHTVRMLVKTGYSVIVLDNLVYGHVDAIVDHQAQLIEGELSDAELLNRIFEEHSIYAVMHFAAYTYVGESVEQPAKYYTNNFAAPLILLECMLKHNCSYFIFSSTCATYGDPEYVPMDEKHPQKPINPYGSSKYFLERVLSDYDKAYGIKSIMLRYFNAAGADEDGMIGEDHDPETHLIPLVLQAAQGLRDNITIYGTDYDTPDGTCIRDYIHVNDLADAHLLALEYLFAGNDSTAFNLGTGQGASVREVISAAETAAGLKVRVVEGERRAGDPPRLVASPSKAKEILGWQPKYTQLEDIIRSAWQFMQGPRKGKFSR